MVKTYLVHFQKFRRIRMNLLKNKIINFKFMIQNVFLC